MPVSPNAMSVDVEDYFQVQAFAGEVNFNDWPSFQSRVRRNTERVLQLFQEHQCRATFFVLGWVAEREPQLVRDIAAAGHEIACHSYAHRQVFRLTPDEFRADLRRAKSAIQDATGTDIYGYRAPTFSIVQRSVWALDILAEEGFLYDSSISPIRHDLYGFPEAPRTIHRRKLGNGQSIIEIPMPTIRLFGKAFPVGGGGWLRLLPMAYTRWGVKRLHASGAPLLVYFHPWEIDPDQPRITGPWRSRLRHYTGLRRMEARIRELLAAHWFVPLLELINTEQL